MNTRAWIFLSGAIWFVIGSSLLYKGVQLVSLPLLGLGFTIGFFKGKFVLSKTAKKMIARIEGLATPISAKDVYPLSYWILIAAMMGLGMVMRFVPNEVRGVVDVAVGYALLYACSHYFIYGSRFPAKSR